MDHFGTFNPEKIRQTLREVEARTASRKDLIVPRSKMSLVQADGGLHFSIEGEETLIPAGRLAVKQLLGTLKVPTQFADALVDRGHTDVVVHTVNTIMGREPKRHMVRTVLGRASAVLSDSYKRVDNDLILGAALPVLKEMKAQVWDLRVNDERLELLAVAPHIFGQVSLDRTFDPGDGWQSRWAGKDGDVQNAALRIKNSEVGLGSFTVDPAILTKICANFNIWGQSFRGIHLGRKHEESENVWLSDETRKLEAEVILGKTRDMIRAVFDPKAFQEKINALNALTQRVIPEDFKTVEVVQAVTLRLGIPAEYREAMLEEMLIGGDRTQYGLMQAISLPANPKHGKTSDEDRSLLEDLAGHVRSLDTDDFTQLTRPLSKAEREKLDKQGVLV